MTNSFSFAELIPEPLTFRDEAFDGDGSVYDVRTGEMLDSFAVVTLMRIEGKITRLIAQANDGPKPEQITEMTELVDQFFAILIPALPDHRHKSIPFQYKMRFIEWWRKQQPETPESGEARMGRKSTPVSSLQNSAIATE